MKTTVQKLFDYLAENTNVTLGTDITNHFINEEKKQITESWESGKKEWCNWLPERHGNIAPTGEQYYKNKFE